MDIDYLIDRLEAFIRNGKRVPLTGNKIMVDEQECYDLIDQMRVTVPEEVKIAKRTLLERERILQDATEDAQQIVENAERERQLMLDKQGLMAEAERQREIIVSAATEEAYELRSQAQAIYDEAVSAAQEMREGANLYAMQVLQELETLLGKHFNMVQNGLKSFKQQADTYQQQMDDYHDQYRPQYAPTPAEKAALRSATNGAKQPATPAQPVSKPANNQPPPQQQQQRPVNNTPNNQPARQNTPPPTQTPPPNTNQSRPVAPQNQSQPQKQPERNNSGNSFTPANPVFNRPSLRPVPKPINSKENDDEDDDE